MSFFQFLKIDQSKNYNSKTILIILVIFSLIFGGYSIYTIIGSPDSDIQSLRTENKSLKKELRQ